MKYRIKYNYDTGNSFTNEYGLESYVELEWKDLEVAKANLQRINEHYKQYEALNSYSNKKSHESILAENVEKDWFVKEERLVVFYENNPERYWAIDEKDLKNLKEGQSSKYIIDEQSAENQIVLYTDEGKPFRFWAPWCGYFESLNFAEIEEDKSDRKIKFK